ncbi:MAG: GNAT family N-acetyltransferase [Clostridiales bacterium]|jgi:predicted acetyltransferase|nr:GNAT family N-acetyltransferase [Clostridiales bacterium]
MNIEFRKLNINDGKDIYVMLQEIPKDECGFVNGCYGRSYAGYRQWLVRSNEISRGKNLEDWMVPSDTYWLYVNGQVVGIGRLRKRLTDELRVEGGNIGYAVRPSCRGRGYGKIILRQLIEKARELKMEKVLITVLNENIASLRVAASCGGVVTKEDEIRKYIWVQC